MGGLLFFAVYFGRYMKISTGRDLPFIGRWRAIACEQELWFGTSRLMRETPNQRVCLAGPRHDVMVTLASLDPWSTQRRQKNESMFLSCSITDGSSTKHDYSFVRGRMATACELQFHVSYKTS